MEAWKPTNFHQYDGRSHDRQIACKDIEDDDLPDAVCFSDPRKARELAVL